MAITYTGTNGFFTRIGKLFKIVEVTDTFKDTLKEEIEDLYGEYTATTGGDAHSHPSGPFDSWQISDISAMKDQINESMFGSLDSMVLFTANNMLIGVVRDGLGKEVSRPEEALSLLRDDMINHASAFKVAASTVSSGSLVSGASSTTAKDNTGTGTVLISTTRPASVSGAASQSYQSIRAETLRFNCGHDNFNGGVAGSEAFTVTGEKSYSRSDKKWPGGSGTKKALVVTSAGKSGYSRNNLGANLLANSNFDIWPSTTSCHLWTLGNNGGTALSSTAGGEGGALGVDYTRSGTTFGSRGDYTLQFNGNGSRKHRVTQRTNHADGTNAKLIADCPYMFACRIKAHTTTITSGVLSLSLFNGASSAISGMAVTKDFSSSNQNNSWTLLSGEINVAIDTLVSDTRVAIEFTTALQADRSLLIDEFVLFKPAQLYTGGPSVAIIRGDTDFRTNDRFDLSFTNNYTGKLNLYFDKYFGNSGFDALLPTGGSTTLADGTYIT